MATQNSTTCPIYDNSYSLLQPTLSVSTSAGMYFCNETFPLTKKFKYVELDVSVNDSNTTCITITPQESVASSSTYPDRYNWPVRIDANMDFQNDGNRPIFDFRYADNQGVPKRANNFPSWSSLGVTQPTRMGCAFNIKKIIIYYIYSASSTKSVYFEADQPMGTGYKMKFGYCRTWYTGSTVMKIYLSRDQWMSSANKVYDEIWEEYGGTELKQY